jgi:hypothetical protein
MMALVDQTVDLIAFVVLTQHTFVPIPLASSPTDPFLPGLSARTLLLTLS